MKRLLALLLSIFVIASCSASRSAYGGEPYDRALAVEVLQMKYPELVRYYNEGVLEITSVREVVVNGLPDYRLKYRFVRYYYSGAEKIQCLIDRFPEIYRLYSNGLINVSSVYKYVDTETMEIRHVVSYREIYGSSIYYSPNIYHYRGYRYYYRPSPPPPPRPRVEPQRPQPQRPGPNPQRSYGNSTRPNNPSSSGNNPRTGQNNRRR